MKLLKLLLSIKTYYLLLLTITASFFTCTDNPISISRKWEFETAGPPGTPAIGNDGTIYVCSKDSIFSAILYAIKPYGTKKWEFKINGNVFLGSPSIGDDGTLYIGVTSGKLLAINTDCGGVADSPWPMNMHDARHTGRQE